MRELLQVQDLKKTFKLSAKQQKIEKTKEKVRTAVDGLSFSVAEGELFGLLGPNGAGKTTTLRMLATLIRPDSGDALVGGASIVKEPDRVRTQLGFHPLQKCFRQHKNASSFVFGGIIAQRALLFHRKVPACRGGASPLPYN